MPSVWLTACVALAHERLVARLLDALRDAFQAPLERPVFPAMRMRSAILGRRPARLVDGNAELAAPLGQRCPALMGYRGSLNVEQLSVASRRPRAHPTAQYGQRLTTACRRDAARSFLVRFDSTSGIAPIRSRKPPASGDCGR